MSIRCLWFLAAVLAWFLCGSLLFWLAERGHPAAERAAKSRAFYNHFVVGEPLKPLP